MSSQFAPSARRRLPLYAATTAAFLVLAASGAALSDEPMIWAEKTNGTSTSLAYGPIDPANGPLFMLSCFNGMSIVVLDVHKEIAGAKPGAPLTIELASAKSKAPIEGEVGLNDATGKTFGEASDVELKPVLAVLRDPGPLTVKMDDTTATLAEQGRDEAVTAFSKNCEVE
jgi:hypothetical protein